MIKRTFIFLRNSIFTALIITVIAFLINAVFVSFGQYPFIGFKFTQHGSRMSPFWPVTYMSVGYCAGGHLGESVPMDVDFSGYMLLAFFVLFFLLVLLVNVLRVIVIQIKNKNQE